MLDFLNNLKDGFLKKSVYIALIVVVGSITYLFAYNGGKNSAKYDCIANERLASLELAREMHTYTNRLDYEYSSRLQQIRHNCNSDNISNVDCRLYQ